MLICYCFNAGAQTQILFQSDQTKSYLLSYINNNEESQQVINEFIDVIAKFIPKPVHQTKITFTIDENVKITREKNTVKIFVEYQNILFNGDIFYKGFNMSEVVFPSKYEFTSTLSRKNGPAIAEFTQPRTNFSPAYNETVLFYNDSIFANSYNFLVHTTKFYYDNESRNRFRTKAVLVDEYYLADLDLDNISKQLSTINSNDFENLEKTQALMNSLKAKTDNIAGAAFWKALHIESFDPLKLSSKLFDIAKNHQQIQSQLDYTKSVIHEAYYNKGVNLYNNKKIQEAKNAFEKSLAYNPVFGPSQFYIALIAYENNKVEDAKKELQKLFSFKNFDNATLRAAYDLANAIQWYDMNIAAGLLLDNKYTEALTAVGKAETFCNSISSVTCNDTIELIKRDCHKGIYASYITTAENLFNKKNYDEAESETSKALNYKQKYSTYITENQDALELMQKVRIEQYYLAMRRGKEKMIAKNFREAFKEFLYAKSIEDEYPVKKDRLLPELLKNSKKEVMLLDLDIAEKDVTDNNLKKARNILKQVIDEQKNYELQNDETLSLRIENLKKAIFSQECANAQKEYDTKIASAIKDENANNYITALSLYSEALKVIENNLDCGISDMLAKKGLANAEKPANYQIQYNQCHEFVKNNNYLKAIETYNKLTAYFNENEISDYGISHLPLHLYISNYESAFVSYGLTWLTDKGEIENALFLLKMLKQRNTVKSATKFQQVALGNAYAIRDFKAGNTLNPKLTVAEYTNNDKWYSFFTKEYLKRIKKLK